MRPPPAASGGAATPLAATDIPAGTVIASAAVALSPLSSLAGHQVYAYHGSESVHTSGAPPRLANVIPPNPPADG